MQAASTEFETLVRQFERRLFSYAMRIIGDSGRAHDVVQEVFMELEKRCVPRAARSLQSGFSLSVGTAR